MYENSFPKKRFDQTIAFLLKNLPPPARILDMGTINPLSDIMREHGYEVFNTRGEDLDLDPEAIARTDVDAVTSFEILEHLVAPFNVLSHIKCDKLIASVPLSLWFAKAYRDESNPWGQHFHEFEDWQFDWLLEKAGWQIQEREKWISPSKKLGIRPILRNFTHRYYIVSAVKREA
ncbi:MAG: methyltransferase [Bacteroidota bacterium]|nr:methyltransferase [Bacteroidota bacterium]